MSGNAEDRVDGAGPLGRAEPSEGMAWFGDRAVVVTTADVAAAHAFATALHAAGGSSPCRIDEVVVGYSSVLVVLAEVPGPRHGTDLARWLARLAGRGPSGGHAEADDRRDARAPTVHELDVVFDGADLAEVAARTARTPADVVDLVTAAELTVAFVGFAPGFPYLTGLPGVLAALPRRATPRTSVPAGSVAVAGGFAAVYPSATPGGWHLLGRTGTSLFDPVRPPHSRVAPGDRVRFVPVDRAEPPAGRGGRDPLEAPGPPYLEVLEPGLASTVQDDGRTGVAGLGVPRAGAADPLGLARVNLLLGNGPGAAAVECTAIGPTVRVAGAVLAAVVGTGAGAVEVTVDGRPVADAAVVPLRHGQVLRVGRVVHGLRAYLGVSGGVATPVLLGSRSSDTLAGLGPGPLRPGDRLATGVPGPARGRLDVPRADRRGRPVVLRVLPGPHGPADGTGWLTSSVWRVGADSDRIGLRLDPTGPPAPTGVAPVASTAMVTGAVQLPPDGRPIVLLPDHATVGGYPVVACVATADLPLLGQLAPGDDLSFAVVDRVVAHDAAVRAGRSRDGVASGWYPTSAGT